MNRVLQKIHEVNAKLPADSPAVAVPVVPALGMMEAAADAADVFLEGDRAGGWLLPAMEALERVPDPGGDLIGRFGEQRAFELAVMAEFWAGCIAGLDEWTRKRGYQGSDAMVDGWFSPIMDRCPPGGWPMTKDGLDEERENFWKTLKGGPFLHDSFLVPWIDRDELRIAPKRCASIMAMRAAQRELLFDFVFSIEDTVDFQRIPFVPGRTIEHRFDYEERHYVLAAAAWRGAVSWLLGAERPNPEPMPVPPDAPGVHLSRLVYHNAERKTVDVSGFWSDGPYAKIVLTTEEARLELLAEGVSTRATASLPGGRFFEMSGFDVRLPWVEDELARLVRSVSACGAARLEVVSTLHE
jgi:hypothetical protein